MRCVLLIFGLAILAGCPPQTIEKLPPAGQFYFPTGLAHVDNPANTDGILYVSMEYATATHLCACGCGLTVVTPISPTDWQISYNGRTVSLYPSIGNRSFPCAP